MKRYVLYEVDLERKTAFCTACGYTEIYIPNTRTQTKPRVICINKARELWLNNRAKQRKLRAEREQRLDRKPRHTLTEINPETLRATCAVCGRTDIRKGIQGKYQSFECLTWRRGYMRKYKRSHYTGLSTNPMHYPKLTKRTRPPFVQSAGL